MSLAQNTANIKEEEVDLVPKSNKRALLSRIWLVLGIFLAIFAAFGLGRLSKIQEGRAASPTLSQVAIPVTATAIEGKFVASKNGSRYYYPWCGGASRIKDENRVWFKTTGEARAAGITPASNCKGLE